jgi:arylsulfatase A-like enzyme
MRLLIPALITTVLLISGCYKEPGKPNIILMMADDLGWGDTGFNGNGEIKTPNMDKLADKGLIFRRFYSASPVCSPTRASCLTGRNPYRMNIPTANSGHLPKNEITLAEVLKEAGYSCGHFGKWHLGTFTYSIRDANRGIPGDSTHISIPTDHGFDEFFSTESKVPTWDPMVRPSGFDSASGESLRYGWTAPVSAADSTFYGTRYWKGLDKQEFDNISGNDSRLIMDRAIDFIGRSVNAEEPFFSVIWFHAPHLPVVVPEEFKSKYQNKSNVQQLYFGTITALDEQLGRLWSSLESFGIEQNTIIFFCSDNGPEVRTPGSAGTFRGRKRDLYEGGVRVPAFITWPSELEGGRLTDFPAFTGDYFPTILDLLNINLPESREIDGISLKQAIFSSKEERSDPIGFLYPGKISWMTNQYKLISTDKGESYELYDLLSDPEEENNLISNKPDVAKELRSQLERWTESVKKESKIPF